MFNIRLYRYNKKTNSTKRPNINAGSVYQCTMKTSSSIINPVIDIKYPEKQIPDFNYAYIDVFKRYYYVTDVVYSIGTWTLSLVVDVLASFREDILASTQYIARAYSTYDNTLVDSLYTTKLASYYSKCDYSVYAGTEVGGIFSTDAVRYTDVNGGHSGAVSPYFNLNFSQGEFLVGIVGNNATGVQYYGMSYNTFKQFVNGICNLQPSNMSGLDSNTANAIYDPLQYVTMTRWYPAITGLDSDSGVTSLKIGSETVTTTGTMYPLDTNRVPEFWIEIDIPRHPRSADYPYMNQSPFSEYNLYFQPFGNIPIDSTKIEGETKLYVSWSVDYATGIAHLRVRPYSHMEQNECVIVDTISEYGVTIPLSSLVMDVKTGITIAGLGYVQDTLSNYLNNRKSTGSKTVNAVSNLIRSGVNWLREQTGRTSKFDEIAGNFNGLIDTVQDAIGSAMGQVKTAGTSGSFLSYNSGAPYIYAFFYDQCEQYPEIFGRPCNRKLKLNTLSGFCLCQSAVVPYTFAYPSELEKGSVTDFLNTGIYIET